MTAHSLVWPVIARIVLGMCFPPALVAGGRSLLRAAFSPLTTYGAADPRRSKMQTLVELPPTDSSVSGFTENTSWLLHGKHEHPARFSLATSGCWLIPGPPGLTREVGQASACHDLFEKWGAAALSTAASKTRLAIADCTSIRPFADFPVSLQPCRHVAAWPVANERIGEGAAEPATNFGCGHTSWSACLSAGSPARMNWLRTRVNLQ